MVLALLAVKATPSLFGLNPRIVKPEIHNLKHNASIQSVD